MLTNSITDCQFSATVPLIVPRQKPRPADVVAEIHKRLTHSKNFDEQQELLCLGLDVLKRRQAERSKGRR